MAGADVTSDGHAGVGAGKALAAPFRRSDALRALALAAALAWPLVAWLGRAREPRDASLVALAVLAPLLGMLARLEDRGPGPLAPLRAALLVLASLCVAPLGWLFGPNAGVVAAIALLALTTGLLSRRGRDSRAAVLVLTLIAGGQAAVTVLVLARVLPDVSLAPVIIPGHADWEHAAAHGAAQLVIIGAFFAGRALRDRYADVHAQMERSTREIAVQSALLAEAREDYRRAVRAARADGVSTTPSIPPPARASPPPGGPTPGAETTAAETTAAPPPPTREASAGATTLWMDAHRARMEIQHGALLGLCAAGIGFLAWIGRNPLPTVVGLVSMSLIAVLALVQREIARRRHDEAFYDPYALIGALSVGPAFAFGLHSAFACVIAALLFFGGTFRAQASDARVGRRLPVYVAVAGSHGLAFALVWTGVVPDAGNQPIIPAGSSPFEPVVLHALLQLTYAAAYLGGTRLDARFQTALSEAAHAEASLRASTETLRKTSAELASLVAESELGLFTGQTIGGYAVGRRLASGGIGDVYEARRARDGAEVALKIVRWERAAEPLALELLAREASALARIESAHVARILEAGVVEDLPFVAMERIDGVTLAEHLRAAGRLEGEALRALAHDLCRGVRDMHDAGVVHRDLTPHNVMLARTPTASTWKIVDFGLAVQGLARGRATRGGTPGYMAPEQALGERVDPRADLYSVSCVLYRAAVGRPAFVGEDAEAIAHRARREGPPDPSAFAPIAPSLALALRIGLAADPRQRFATARELATAIAAALDGHVSEPHRARAADLPLRREP